MQSETDKSVLSIELLLLERAGVHAERNYSQCCRTPFRALHEKTV